MLDHLPGDRLKAKSLEVSESPGNSRNSLKKSPKLLVKSLVFLDKENTCQLIRAAETQSVGLCAHETPLH